MNTEELIAKIDEIQEVAEMEDEEFIEYFHKTLPNNNIENLAKRLYPAKVGMIRALITELKIKIEVYGVNEQTK